MQKQYLFKKTIRLLFCLGMVVLNSCGDENFWDIKTATVSDDINGVVINGVRWATRNVGAPGTFAARPENHGMFYQWNRKIGWSSKDRGIIGSNGVTEWDSSIPTGATWEKSNDPSPTGWRLPTTDEIQKLLDSEKVKSEAIYLNGIEGSKFTDKTTGNTLFLPYACILNDNTLSNGFISGTGAYWSSEQGTSTDDAYSMYLGTENRPHSFPQTLELRRQSRIWGCSIRPVAE